MIYIFYISFIYSMFKTENAQLVPNLLAKTTEEDENYVKNVFFAEIFFTEFGENKKKTFRPCLSCTLKEREIN